MGILETQESVNLNIPRDSGPPSQPDNIFFSENSRMCCVGFVDMVDSTRITAGLTMHQMSKYYSLFINWVSGIISGYSGKVVKTTGDGLLYYYDLLGDSPIKTVRNCLNSAITLSVLHRNVNSKFISELLPELNYRISLDYGEVTFAQTADSTTDIFSTTVNICAKINKVVEPNKVIIGGDLYTIARNLSGYDFQDAKKTISISKRAYPLYIVSEAKTNWWLLVGNFTSAINVSQDGELRRDFRKSAMANLNLLRTMGIAQMEKELIKNFKLAEKNSPNIETTQDYSEENVKQIVHEVLQELKQKEFGKRKQP